MPPSSPVAPVQPPERPDRRADAIRCRVSRASTATSLHPAAALRNRRSPTRVHRPCPRPPGPALGAGEDSAGTNAVMWLASFRRGCVHAGAARRRRSGSSARARPGSAALARWQDRPGPLWSRPAAAAARCCCIGAASRAGSRAGHRRPSVAVAAPAARRARSRRRGTGGGHGVPRPAEGADAVAAGLGGTAVTREGVQRMPVVGLLR